MPFEHISEESKNIESSLVEEFDVETKRGKILCGRTITGKVVVRINGDWGYRDWWGAANHTVGDTLRYIMDDGGIEPPPIPKRGNFIDMDAAQALAAKHGYTYP